MQITTRDEAIGPAQDDNETFAVFTLGKGRSWHKAAGPQLSTVNWKWTHADTIVCGLNCIIMHFTGKECNVSPYTDTYEAIKSVPIVQAATAYDNPETGETTILILNEAIWMGDKMDHTLVNPNQRPAYGITVQDNPFSDSPTFISTEGHEVVLPLKCNGTILGVATRTPTESELQICPHIALSSDHEWDP